MGSSIPKSAVHFVRSKAFSCDAQIQSTAHHVAVLALVPARTTIAPRAREIGNEAMSLPQSLTEKGSVSKNERVDDMHFVYIVNTRNIHQLHHISVPQICSFREK